MKKSLSSIVCLLQVKQQHLDNNIQFLSEELQVADKREAKDRVFFVSARETLVSRLQDDTGIPTPGMKNLFNQSESLFILCNIFHNKKLNKNRN